MLKFKNGQTDLTDGPIFSKVFLFVIPLMITNLLQVLYNAADMMVVSLSSEGDAVGAIGITGAMINLINNIFFGFATGTNVVVARYLGAKDEENTSKAVHTSVIMSILFGLASTVVGLFISRPVLSLMGAEGRLLDLATTYTALYFCGVPFIALTNYEISIFRAKGDTKTPLYILSFAGVVNVALNAFFVLVCGLSVEGVAIATVIANITSAALLLWKLSKDEGECRFSFKKLRIDKGVFKEICVVGLPAGLQGSLFSLSNMTIQSSIIKMNSILTPVGSEISPVVNGNAAAQSLESFIYTATNSVYQASITFTSQNAGAGKYKRVPRVMSSCYFLTFLIAIAVGAFMFVFKVPLLSFYKVVDGEIGSLAHIAFNTASIRMNYMFYVYFLLGFMEVGSGAVRGLGKSSISAVISLLGACVFRVLWVLIVFEAYPSLEIIYISYPISWILTALAQFVYTRILLKRLTRASE